MSTTRYFITTSANFEYSGSPDTRAQGNITAHVFLDGASSPSYVLGLGSGIAENEFSPGDYKYDIEDFEIVAASTVSVEWYAREFSSGDNMDDFPLVTTPTPDTEISTPLTVSSTDPSEGDTGVSTRDAIVVTFSEVLDDSETLQNHQLMLRIAGTTKLLPATKYVNSNDKTQLVIKPQSQLPETTTLALVLPKDAFYADSGARLAEDFILKFTTGADDFQTVHEAADDGTPERRAGPLIISGGSTAVTTSSSSASVSTLDPVDKSYNISGTQFDVIYDKDVDGYTAEVELDVTPLFGINELYFINDSPWNKSSEPSLPVVDSVTFIAPRTIRINLDKEPPQNAIMNFTISNVDTFDSDNTLYSKVDAATTGDIGATYNAAGGTGGEGQFTGAPATIDGYSLSNGDRVLVKDQTDALENGIYEVVSSGTWDRAADMDEDSEVVTGAYVYVENGTVGEDSRFVISSTDPTLNTDDIEWTEVSFPLDEADEVAYTVIGSLFPFLVGVPEVKNVVSGYISSDLTDTDIATYITNVGVDLYFTYGIKMKHILRCIIKNQVAMDLFDDWLSRNGMQESKTLGAFSVRKSGPAAGIFSDGPYARLAKKLESCQRKLDLYYNGPRSGVKSANSSVERPNYRIRTWRRSTKGDITDDENRILDRHNKLPGKHDDWS